jgi:hypothetical protein
MQQIEKQDHQSPTKNYLQRLSSDMAILTSTPKTATDALNSTSYALSVCIKQNGTLSVDFALINILRQIFELTLSPINADQLTAIAVQIRTNFWMLKFEEVIFALNKGINGGYGKIFGNLSYIHLAEWLNTYLDDDRLIAVTDMRIKEKALASSIRQDNYPSIDLMYKDCHHIPKEVKKVQSSESKMLGMFQAFGHTYDIDQLEGELEFATDKGWTMLINEIKNEIEKR